MKKQLSHIAQVGIFIVSPAIIPTLWFVLSSRSVDSLSFLPVMMLVSFVFGVAPAILTACLSYCFRRFLRFERAIINNVIWLVSIVMCGYVVSALFLSVIRNGSSLWRFGGNMGMVSAFISCVVILLLEYSKTSTKVHLDE